MRIAAVGDLHCRADTRKNIGIALAGVDSEAQCLLLAGDLTAHGTPAEASCLAEELKLENALFQLRTRVRIGLLHYSPCRPTLEGEPLEIFPFLGATRLSGPIDQLRPAAVFHGHAHRGTLRGATRGGVPVYN